jgi:hypothetical protein
LLLVSITLVGGLLSCRKGEDDPAFTLLSRKARLTGMWKFQEGSLVVDGIDSTGRYNLLKYTFTADAYIMAVPGNGASFNGAHHLTLTFGKKGEFSLDQALDTSSLKATGSWDFEGRVGKARARESVFMTLKEFDGSSQYIDLFNKSGSNCSYHIRELRNKRLVLETNDELIQRAQQGFEYRVTSVYIFAQ